MKISFLTPKPSLIIGNWICKKKHWKQIFWQQKQQFWSCLAGGWTTNLKTYARQIGSSPQVGIIFKGTIVAWGLHPTKIGILNPEMEVSKMIFHFNYVMFWFHVNFPGWGKIIGDFIP